VLVLPAKEQLKVFNPAENENNERTGAPDDEHAFENPHQDNDNKIHKLSMLFETRAVDQFQIGTKIEKRFCYAGVCDESPPAPGF
jgi:hypothetical protein